MGHAGFERVLFLHAEYAVLDAEGQLAVFELVSELDQLVFRNLVKLNLGGVEVVWGGVSVGCRVV